MFVGLLLAACVETDDLITDRIESFKGLTMAQFSATSGMVPYNAYNTSEGRTFLVSEPGCDLLLHTVPIDGRAVADSWRIEHVTARGACGAIL